MHEGIGLCGNVSRWIRTAHSLPLALAVHLQCERGSLLELFVPYDLVDAERQCCRALSMQESRQGEVQVQRI